LYAFARNLVVINYAGAGHDGEVWLTITRYRYLSKILTPIFRSYPNWAAGP
jgi:hypothetical protein